MKARNIVRYDDDFSFEGQQSDPRLSTANVRARDRANRSMKHVLLQTPETPEIKRPRPSYVEDKLHDKFAEIGVLESVEELGQLQKASEKPTVVRVISCPEDAENTKVDIRWSPRNGKGLYVKENAKLEMGEILTEFPGPPKWVKTDSKGEIPLTNVTEYVFALGPFKIPGVYGKYSIVWGSDIAHCDDYEGPCRGHLINSSHPRHRHPGNVTNCVYGVFYDRLVLDIKKDPDIILYAVACKPVVGGKGSEPLFELRTEYHWCLAFHFGYWCLNVRCHECLHALRDFVDRHLPKGLNVETGDDSELESGEIICHRKIFDPTAPEVLSPPFPGYKDIPFQQICNVFTIENCARDGNCLFRAISRGVYEREREWRRVKANLLQKWDEILPQLRKRIDDDEKLDECRRVLMVDNAWGGLDHIYMAEIVFNVAIYVWCGNLLQQDPKRKITGDLTITLGPSRQLGNVRKVIHLLHEYNVHYDYLIPNKMAIPTTPANKPPECLHPETTLTNRTSLSESSGLHRSFSTSSTSTSASRRSSNSMFAVKLCNVNMFDDVSNRFGAKKKDCCSRECIKIVQEEGSDMYRLTSKVFEDVTAVYNACRKEQSRRKEQERGSWVLEQYKMSFTTCTTRSGKTKIVILPYVLLFGDSQRLQVCRLAFDVLYGVSKSMRDRFISLLKAEGATVAKIRDRKKTLRLVLGESPEITQLTCSQYACVAFIRNYCSMNGEKISNSSQIRIAFPKRMVRTAYLNTFRCHLVGKVREEDLLDKRPGKPVCRTIFYALWGDYCGNIACSRKKKGFAICHTCKKHVAIDCDPTLSNEDKRNNREEFASHLKDVELCKLDYYERQQLACDYPSYYMSKIIDACDCDTTEIPKLKAFSKKEDKFKEDLLTCKMFGVRVHSNRKRDYMYLIPPFVTTEGGTNMTLEVLFRTLKLEEEHYKTNGLKWPKTLFLQLDNTGKENKNSIMWSAASYLVAKGLFNHVEVNFLPVGHTHEDIDQAFSVITRALERSDAYTYPQWEKLVYEAYNDEWNTIKHVEMLWSVLDYKGWLGHFMNSDRMDPYKGYVSHAFHFLFYKEPNLSLLDDRSCPWVMKYAKYSFHKKDEDFQYFPRAESHPLLSWLSEEPYGEPDIQNPWGIWYDKNVTEDNDSQGKHIDRVMALSKIIELLRMPSNAANEEDVAWWRAFFDMIPSSTKPLPRDRRWDFSVPDPEYVNCTAKYTSVDLRQLDNVDPTPAPKCEFLVSKYMTKAQKRDTLKLLDEMSTIDQKKIDIDENTFIVFRTGPDWADLGKEQEGMDEKCTALPFTLAKTVSMNRKKPSSDAHVWVEIWYAVNGDPNGIWCRWERKRDNGKGSPWLLEIEHDTILLINPDFHEKKGMSKVMTAKTRKELALVPGIGYSYLAGGDGGLMPTEEVEKRMKLQQKVLQRSTSTSGIRKKKALDTKMLHHRRTQAIMKRKLLTTQTESSQDSKKVKV